MEKDMSTKNGNRTLVFFVLFLILAAVTVYSAVTGNEGIFAPMLMLDQVLLMIWLTKPKGASSKVAYYSIITYGLFIALLSVFFNIFGADLSERFELGTNIDDKNGITYPIINDGRENCYFTSMLFVFYFVILAINRIIGRKKTDNAALN